MQRGTSRRAQAGICIRGATRPRSSLQDWSGGAGDGVQGGGLSVETQKVSYRWNKDGKAVMSAEKAEEVVMRSQQEWWSLGEAEKKRQGSTQTLDPRVLGSWRSQRRRPDG